MSRDDIFNRDHLSFRHVRRWSVLLFADAAVAARIQEILSRPGRYVFDLVCARTITEADALVQAHHVDVLVVDLLLEDPRRQDLLAWMARKNLPAVVVIPEENDEWLEKAFHYGAQDYVVSGSFDRQVLARSIIHAREHDRITRDLVRHQDNLERTLRERTAELVAANQKYREEITVRQKREEDLHKQDMLFRQIITNIPHAVFWKDRNSVYLGCNENFAKISGAGRAEHIQGKTDYDLGWPPGQVEAFRRTDRQVIEGGEPLFNYDEKQVWKDGREYYVLSSKVPLRNERGEIFGVLGIYADMTDQKKIERELRDRVEDLRRFQEVAVNREMRMIELKKEVNRLAQELRRAPVYDLAFLHETEQSV